MATIAAGAGVAVQTLYLSFGSKVAILEAAHDTAVVGDNEPIPLLERDWAAEARDDPNGLRALDTIMSNARLVNTRVAPIYGVIQSAAADPEVATLLGRIRGQRLSTMRVLAENLATKRGFTPSHTAEWAADVLYAVASIELLGLLTEQRPWPVDEFDAWAYDIAAAQLFPKLGAARRRAV